MFFQPHFVRDYRRLVRTLSRNHDRDAAMERAIGGGYESVGVAQAALLLDAGLRESDYLIDVGCGSGRTAFALRSMPALQYHGTDVVPELLAYAKEKVARPDWRFSLVEGLTIPDADGRADFVTMFSVVSHLSMREAQQYLLEAIRVTKPDGKIVVSFLDDSNAMHLTHVTSWTNQFINRMMGAGVRNVAHSLAELEALFARLHLRAQFFGPERIGQSYCILTQDSAPAAG